MSMRWTVGMPAAFNAPFHDPNSRSTSLTLGHLGYSRCQRSQPPSPERQSVLVGAPPSSCAHRLSASTSSCRVPRPRRAPPIRASIAAPPDDDVALATVAQVSAHVGADHTGVYAELGGNLDLGEAGGAH